MSSQPKTRLLFNWTRNDIEQRLRFNKMQELPLIFGALGESQPHPMIRVIPLIDAEYLPAH